ncbi:protein pxr1-like [Anneissia japonica]|uniref:protein pxr1-like n=1 Tax=Anneissia japonica TaxID=1529436 RepID=UPI00142557E0|nr:protein pxr1-like [Anneissia japonica]
MVFLIIVAFILFSIIIRRYRKNRLGRSRGAMYTNSNEYVMHQFGTSDVPEQDGYRRQEKENGDRVIEITMEDAATSNDFKYHEHKDDISVGNNDYVHAGYDNEGADLENGEHGGATGGYYVDAEVENRSNRMIDIHDQDDLEEDEFGLNRKSAKGKKNKSSKKKSKFKKSSDKSKQKGSNKVKKQQDSEPQAVKEVEDDDVSALNTQVNKKPTKTDETFLKSSNMSASTDGLYQSMEELNDTTITEESPKTENKLSSEDKDVVANTESVYAQVDREHLATKKRQKQHVSQSHVADGSQKHINNLSPTGSHTTGSDEGYGEEIEAAV